MKITFQIAILTPLHMLPSILLNTTEPAAKIKNYTAAPTIILTLSALYQLWF